MNLNLPENMNPKGNVQWVIWATYFMAFPVSVSNILNINGKKISLDFFNFIPLEHNFLARYWVRSSNRYTINS